MTAEEEAIRARREAAVEKQGWVFAPMSTWFAVERASTVTPEEFDRAYEAYVRTSSCGTCSHTAASLQALRAAFGAAGFEVKS